MANAGFQNYRPRQTFWYIETNVVLRRPPTPISKLLFEPYLLHYMYWSLANSYLLYITSSGPCPTVTSPISHVLNPALPIYPYITSTGPYPTVASTISQKMDPFLQLPSPYHKYLFLVDRFISYITNTGTCHTVTSPISQVLVPILQVHPLYHKYCSLSYSFLPHITSTGPRPTGTGYCPIAIHRKSHVL